MAEEQVTSTEIQTNEATPAPAAAAPPQLAAAPAPAQSSWRDVLREKARLDFGDMDDAKALEALANTLTTVSQRHQQFQQLQPVLSEYQQHQEAFRKYLESQQKEAAQPQTQKEWYAEHWNPPEFDPSWMSRLSRDAQGQIVLADPNDDPAIIAKTKQYDAYLRNFQAGFMRNPAQAMQPFIDARVQELVEAKLNERLQSRDQVQEAASYVQQRPWLYEQDEKGTFKTDPFTRQPVLSQYGQMAQQIIAREQQRQQKVFGRMDQDSIMQAVDQEIRMHYLQSDEYRQSLLAGGKEPAEEQEAAPPQSPLERANALFLQKKAQPIGRKSPTPSAPKKQMTQRDMVEQMLRQSGRLKAS